MCFAWNGLHCNLWVIFNASKCVVINRIKSPFSSPLKSGTTYKALIISNDISDIAKEKLNIFSCWVVHQMSWRLVERWRRIFCERKKKEKNLWSLWIDFRTACCVSSCYCHLAFFLITSVYWKPWRRLVSVWSIVFFSQLIILPLFFSYRTLCNTCSPKHYLLLQGDALNVKSHNYRSFPAQHLQAPCITQ